MTTKPDYWNEGYLAAVLGGKSYPDNPYEGKEGATPWAFGCGEGMKDRNRTSINRLLAALSGGRAEII